MLENKQTWPAWGAANQINNVAAILARVRQPRWPASPFDETEVVVAGRGAGASPIVTDNLRFVVAIRNADCINGLDDSSLCLDRRPGSP